MTVTPFEVSINPLWPGQKLKPKSEGETRWGRHPGAWRTEEHSLESFAQRICQDGYAFCAVLKIPWRKEANFKSLQVLATDHDGASLEMLLEDSFVHDHAALAYETPSSTPTSPRSRAVYILDQAITDPNQTRLAYRALIAHFANGAPDAEADRACKDPTRFFYGRPEGRHVILGNVLYLDILQEIIEQHSRFTPGHFTSSETFDIHPHPRQHSAPYNPHSGVPLEDEDRQKLARALVSAGLRLDGDRFNGPCILPHRDGPCDCPGAMYVSSITGAWFCFCPDHVGPNHGGLSALHSLGSQPPTTDLSFEEVAALLGGDFAGPDVSRYTPGKPREGHVPDTVSDCSDTYRPGDITAGWAEASALFPYPNDIKPLKKAVALYSERDRQGLAVDMLSNTWRNPVNAQSKRRRLYFNLKHRMTGPVYHREMPFDDWTPQLHESLTKRISRSGGSWLRVDNALSHGVFHYLTNLALEGFEEVSDLPAVLVALLRGISPPGPEEPGRFRPVSGSASWMDHSDSTWELDRGRWEVIAGYEGPTSWSQVEAQAIVKGALCRDVRPYWRCQVGDGLAVELPTYEGAVEFFVGLGYAPSKSARARVGAVATAPAGEQ